MRANSQTGLEQMASVGNDGQGYFIDETGTRLPEEEILWNNDADFRDVDLDGDSDMFVVNVFPGENAYDALYINDGSGAFPTFCPESLISPLLVLWAMSMAIAMTILLLLMHLRVMSRLTGKISCI